MKTRIIDLARRLSMLEHPINVLELGKLLHSCQDLFSKPLAIDSEIEVQWQIITNIYKIYLKVNELKTRELNGQLLAQQVKELYHQKLSLEPRLNSLLKDEADVRKRIDSHSPELLKACEGSTSSALPRANDGDEPIIRQFFISTRDEYQRLLLQNHQVIVGDKLLLRDEAIQKLNALNVIFTTSTTIKHASLFAANSLSESKRLHAILQQLSSSKTQLIDTVSKNDLVAEIQDLQKRILFLEDAVTAIGRQINESKLVNIRELDDLYSATSNIEDLLKDRQNRVSYLNSYWPGALAFYLANPEDHNEELTREQSELEYLELLHDKDNAAYQLAQLSEILDDTKKLLSDNSREWVDNPKHHLSSDAINLIINAIQGFIPGFIAREPVSSVSLLIELDKILPELERACSRHSQIIALLPQFIEAKKELSSLEASHVFSGLPEDFVPPARELAVLKEESAGRQNELIRLAQLSSKCQNLLAEFGLLRQISQQIEGIRTVQTSTLEKLAQLENELLRLDQHPIDPQKLDTHIASLSLELKLLQTTIKPHELSTKPQETLEAALTNARMRRASTMDLHLGKLQYWNSKIIVKLQQLPADLNSWYVKLFMCLQQQHVNEATKRQMYQLLKDILFEMNEPSPSAPYSLLYKYKSLCENPSEQWSVLLSFKPPVEPNLQEKGKFHPILQSQLDSLLNRKYSREAKLCADLAHQLQKQPAQNANTSIQLIRNYLSDPRYQSLYEHRGFWILSQWAAKVSTALWNCFAENKSSFYQSVFYKSTSTVHSLQEDFELANTLARQ
ncbi:hypothetical protein B1207_07240 [Legionella quinlivanii]|uniref:Effector protein A, substrate of the Dot/Icm secretion system n=1 Tax=Legionella quinlivanii TaxID=45073 RepID=A0A364LJ81_9GAMM|nr:hypothetical protein [Legionella quinlivanii]RAP36593.1 hypothetical protein B1207_07240 [Legionella quinlivanii]